MSYFNWSLTTYLSTYSLVFCLFLTHFCLLHLPPIFLNVRSDLSGRSFLSLITSAPMSFLSLSLSLSLSLPHTSFLSLSHTSFLSLSLTLPFSLSLSLSNAYSIHRWWRQDRESYLPLCWKHISKLSTTTSCAHQSLCLCVKRPHPPTGFYKQPKNSLCYKLSEHVAILTEKDDASFLHKARPY